jgi:hypothetical protein
VLTFQVGNRRRAKRSAPKAPPHGGYSCDATFRAAERLGRERLDALADACMIVAGRDYGAGGTRQRVVARWLLASCLRYWAGGEGEGWEEIAERAVKRACA